MAGVPRPRSDLVVKIDRGGHLRPPLVVRSERRVPPPLRGLVVEPEVASVNPVQTLSDLDQVHGDVRVLLLPQFLIRMTEPRLDVPGLVLVVRDDDPLHEVAEGSVLIEEESLGRVGRDSGHENTFPIRSMISSIPCAWA